MNKDFAVKQYIKEHPFLTREALIEGLIKDLGLTPTEAVWAVA